MKARRLKKTPAPPPAAPAALRRKAIARIKKKPAPASPPADPQRLLHELQVHQVELEMQNEELQRIRQETATALDQYTDLYDHAPVGYCTLGTDGTVLKLNLLAATLLGAERSRIMGRRFALWLAAGDRPAFSQFLAQEMTGGGKQVCEVRLEPKATGPRVLQAKAIRVPGKPECRLVLLDITERKEAEQQLWLAHRHATVLGELGHLLAETVTLREAATCILMKAKELLGWDSSYVCLWDEAAQSYLPLANFDQLDGQTQEVATDEASNRHPFPTSERVRQAGGRLILRADEADQTDGLVPFGNGRRSLSLLFVPIWHLGRFIGIASIQSYTRQAYKAADLGLLQSLADHCAGALLRIQAQVAVAEAEHRLQLVWDGAQDGLRLIDAEGRIMAVNEAYCENMGKPRSELVGRHLTIVYADPEPALLRAAYQQQFKTHTVRKRMEKQVTLWNGKTLWLEVSTTFLEDDRKPPLMLGSLRDITERKQAEEALREKELLLSESQRTAHIGGWSWNFTGPIDWTEETYRIYEVSPDNFVPTIESLASLIHPEDRSALQEWVRGCCAGERPAALEFRRLRSDGTVKFLNGCGELVCDAGNKPVRIVGTVQDITERKLTDVALRESEERFLGFMDQSPVVAWLKDHEFKFRYVNAAWEQLFRRPSSQMHGRTDYEFFDQKTADQFRANDRRVLELREKLEAVEETRGADGRKRHWLVQKFPLQRTGQPLWTGGTAVDITARVEAEEALRHSESLFRMLADVSPVGIFRADASGAIVYVNDQLCQITGLYRAQILAEGWAGVIHPEDRDYVLACLAQTTQTGEPFSAHHRLQRLDGRILWVVSQCWPEVGPAGESRGRAGTLIDITERKQAEAALLASEARLRAIIEASPVPMALNDQAHRITYLNPAFTRTFGYDHADIPTLADWWPKAYPDPAYRQWLVESWQVELARAAQTGTPFTPMEVKVRCKDGTERFIVASTAPLSDGFDDTNLVVLLDITERKRAEAAVAESERFTRAAFDALPAQIAVLDGEGRIISTNRSWDAFARENDADETSASVGVNYLAVCDRAAAAGNDDARQTAGLIREVLAGNRTENSFECACHTPTQQRWFLCWITRFDGPGPMRLVVAHDNITPVKQAQERLVAAEHFAATGRMAAGIAHEINNPLNGIKNCFALVKRAVPETHPDYAYTRLIEREIDRIAGVVRRMFTLYRPTRQQPTEFQLDRLVQDIVELMRPGATAVRVELVFEAPAVSLEVRLPEAIMSEVLHNLLRNALEASPPDGRVTVSLHGDDARVWFNIADQGAGIPPAVRPHIYEPFYTTKSGLKDGGMGLGLSLVRSNVESLRGRICADCPPTGGTVFHVELPRRLDPTPTME